ncbi:hypothetical protein SAMN03097699_1477 [Flavobacteriaceae bacterium MAR_2010_188]|nr:hypothetical protein SAMN03097699_1477 [Flavobacteriaceae bacterium MAR_2010_188]
MKTSLLYLTISLFVFSCEDVAKSTTDDTIEKTSTIDTTAITPLDGAWELVGYYNYEDDKVIDSFKQREGFRQVKMYSPSKVMWSKQVPTDSTEWFGFGSYRIEDGQLVEVLDYGSEMMTKIITEREEFRYDLILSKNSFIQIEIDDDGNKIYSENYRRIE